MNTTATQDNETQANETQDKVITISRQMATHFVKAYYTTVYAHVNDTGYYLQNYTDDFYEGCIQDEELRLIMSVLSDFNYLKHIQVVYDAIHTLMSPNYSLIDNIAYCSEHINIDEHSVLYLQAANKNYQILNNIAVGHYCQNPPTSEDLSDTTFENNTCTICHYENITTPGLMQFHYSTSFGLNLPVCRDCALSSEIDSERLEEKEEKDDPDYLPPSDDEDDDEEVCNDKYVDSDAEEEEEDDAHSANGDDYKEGWEAGWEAAMRYVEQQVKECHNAPSLPACDNCGAECRTKKCGGTCNGYVKYCSVACQVEHWKEVHRFACLKKE